MAAITNPTAVSFSNQRIRVAADLIAQLDALASTILAQWTALGGTALIPNTADVIVDGASVNGVDAAGGDGRPVITGAKANNIVNRLTEMRSTVATAGLALGVAGVRDTVLQVAVNPVPRS